LPLPSHHSSVVVLLFLSCVSMLKRAEFNLFQGHLRLVFPFRPLTRLVILTWQARVPIAASSSTLPPTTRTLISLCQLHSANFTLPTSLCQLHSANFSFTSTSPTKLNKSAVSRCHQLHSSSYRVAARAAGAPPLRAPRPAANEAQHPVRRVHPRRIQRWQLHSAQAIPACVVSLLTKLTAARPRPHIHQAAYPTRRDRKNQIWTKMRSTMSSWLLICSSAIWWAVAITSHEMRSSTSWKMCILQVQISWIPVGHRSCSYFAGLMVLVRTYIDPTVVLISTSTDDAVLDRLDPGGRSAVSVNGDSESII
jgi:hypothetical protein